MKTISQEQINGVLELVRKYNIGVNDFIALQKLFDKLPVEKDDDNKKPKV